jgi:hypothetical protein
VCQGTVSDESLVVAFADAVPVLSAGSTALQRAGDGASAVLGSATSGAAVVSTLLFPLQVWGFTNARSGGKSGVVVSDAERAKRLIKQTMDAGDGVLRGLLALIQRRMTMNAAVGAAADGAGAGGKPAAGKAAPLEVDAAVWSSLVAMLEGVLHRDGAAAPTTAPADAAQTARATQASSSSSSSSQPQVAQRALDDAVLDGAADVDAAVRCSGGLADDRAEALLAGPALKRCLRALGWPAVSVDLCHSVATSAATPAAAVAGAAVAASAPGAGAGEEGVKEAVEVSLLRAIFTSLLSADGAATATARLASIPVSAAERIAALLVLGSGALVGDARSGPVDERDEHRRRRFGRLCLGYLVVVSTLKTGSGTDMPPLVRLCRAAFVQRSMQALQWLGGSEAAGVSVTAVRSVALDVCAVLLALLHALNTSTGSQRGEPAPDRHAIFVALCQCVSAQSALVRHVVKRLLLVLAPRV